GLTGLLAVARGSREEPRFIRLRWAGPGTRRRVILVGKGITFDSGGLSLKPPKSMETMKYDMAGGAAAIGAGAAAARLRLPGGVMGNDERLVAKLIEAGRAASEPLWQLPLVREYRDDLKSPIADLKNVGGEAGAITAGLFLEEFVDGVPWAHLDIAGPAFTEKD